jgi:hypothetical protein
LGCGVSLILQVLKECEVHTRLSVAYMSVNGILSILHCQGKRCYWWRFVVDALKRVQLGVGSCHLNNRKELCYSESF